MTQPQEPQNRRFDADVEAEIRRQLAADTERERQAAVRRQVLAEQEARHRAAMQQPPEMRYTPPPASGLFPPHRPQGRLQRWQGRGGILGVLATALIFLVKFAAPVIAIGGKLFLTFGSLLLSVAFQAQLSGWPLAVTIIGSILIHECGHALAYKIRGLPMNNMVFLPFMGAYVSGTPARSVAESAFIAIMGPVAGLVGAVVAALLYQATGSSLWLLTAWFGFLINLMNLAPIWIFDGRHVIQVFSPKWVQPERLQPYAAPATESDRLRFGAAYFALVAVLLVGMVYFNSERGQLINRIPPRPVNRYTFALPAISPTQHLATTLPTSASLTQSEDLRP